METRLKKSKKIKKDFVILVDENDKKIGLKEKIRAHLGKGILHRAFIVFIFNEQGKLLIQKRSKEKMLWPLYWDCSCASHPKPGETYQKAGERRLKEELGFTVSLKVFDKFQYTAQYKNIGTEKEIAAVLVGKHTGKVKPFPKEVADWKWVKINQLQKDIAKTPQKYTPWLKIGLKRILKNKLWFLRKTK